uniref:Unannotated protein n=1 Tax=freshwater metagenome TaxID=449393 RepID=A0A6J5ZWR0_9ZZZZ
MLACAAPASADWYFPTTEAEQRAEGVAMGKEAYTYGFPINEFNLIREADLEHAPLNVLSNAQELAGPSAQGVVAPNTDTLYSLAQIDLGDGPVVLKVPKMHGRYWTFEFVEPYTNVVGYIGRRLNGSAGGTWALQWSGAKAKKPLPKGVKVFKSSARRLWVIGRTLVSGKRDEAKAKKLMAQYRLGTLADLVARKPLPKPRSLTPGRAKTVEPTGLAFLDKLSAAMAADPPPARDADIVARLAHFGIGAGLRPSTAGLPGPVLEGLAQGVDAAAAALPGQSKLPVLAQARANGGWYNPAPEVGAFGTNYVLRARAALLGIGINTVIESTYPIALTDSAGVMLNGANSYRMVFKRGKLPPVRGFWSLTMYDSDGYLVPNAANVYAIGPDHPGMITRKDGSVVIVVQQQKPTEKGVNWLPSPPAGFRLNLRLYLPSKSILKGTWKPPAVEKVG